MFLNLSGKTFCLSRSEPILQQIIDKLSEFHTTIGNFSFFSNGRLLETFDVLPTGTTISAIVPLKGGKGGFGTKLKTEGGKKVRPNDNMFSRDQSGKRVVYATQEKQFKEFVKKSIEEERNVAMQREKVKIMENTLKDGLYSKLDKAYKKEIQATEQNLAESIRIGIQRKMIEKKNNEKEDTNENVVEKPKEQAFDAEERKVDNLEDQSTSVKRNLPDQFKQQVQGEPEKKQKIEDPKPKVPLFQRAQEKFKLLMKK